MIFHENSGLYRFRFPIIGLLIVVASVFGIRIANYFGQTMPPNITLIGIEDGGHYAKRITCEVQGKSDYEVAQVHALLDGKPFEIAPSTTIGRASFALPFIMDTEQLANGEHTLVVRAQDASFSANKAESRYTFTIDNTPLKAALLAPEYKVLQGRTIHVKVNASKEVVHAQVQFLSDTYDCCRESSYTNVYECFIPIDCEQPAREYTLSAKLRDAVGNEAVLAGKATVEAANFKRQTTLSVAREKLEDEKEVSIGGNVFEDTIEKMLAASPKEKLWAGSFDLPIDAQRISTEYGEVRTTPEKGKYMHKAVDIVNHPKSVVWASEGGKVIVKDRYLMTGNTVVIDHGMGVHTIYSHLDGFSDIKVGDMLKKGNPIGQLGKTGYATGYHLHWELRVNNMAVDPLQWTKKTF